MILSLSLTGRCNFLCHSCPTAHSRLLLKEWSPEDTAQVRQFVQDSGVRQIMLTGGEPSLVLDAISEIQRALPSDVRYTMTTNGTFFRDFEENLKKIRLENISISIDKFHAPFGELDSEKVAEYTAKLREREISTSIFSVVEEHSDYLHLSEFADLDLDVVSYSRISFPCLFPGDDYLDSDFKTSTAIDSCPNCGPQDDEVIFFYPGYGFCRCSGRMLYEKHIDPMEFFANSFATLKDHPLWKDIFERGLDGIANRYEIDHLKKYCKTACDFCVGLHSRILDKNDRSLVQYLENISEIRQINVSEEISSTVSAALRKQYWIRYGYVGNTKYFPEGRLASVESMGLTEIDLTVIDPDEYIRQCEFVFNRNRFAGYSPEETEIWRKALRNVVAGGVGRFRGVVFKLGDVIVGSVIGVDDAWSLTSTTRPGLYMGDIGTPRADLLSANQIDVIFERSIYWLRSWAEEFDGLIGVMLMERDRHMRDLVESWGMQIKQVIITKKQL